jgi:hypothetical protein
MQIILCLYVIDNVFGIMLSRGMCPRARIPSNISDPSYTSRRRPSSHRYHTRLLRLLPSSRTSGVNALEASEFYIRL